MTQAAAGDHRDQDAGGRHYWRDNQAGLVAHAAGGVLVHFDARDTRQVQGYPGAHDQVGEIGNFRF